MYQSLHAALAGRMQSFGSMGQRSCFLALGMVSKTLHRVVPWRAQVRGGGAKTPPKGQIYGACKSLAAVAGGAAMRLAWFPASSRIRTQGARGSEAAVAGGAAAVRSM